MEIQGEIKKNFLERQGVGDTGAACGCPCIRPRMGYASADSGLPRHQQPGQHPAEDAGDGQPVHLLGGENGDGVPQLAAHIDLQTAQDLAALHRGLYVFSQREPGGYLALLPPADQQTAVPLQFGLNLALGPQKDVYGGQGGLRVDRDHRIVGKAVVQEGLGVVKTLVGAGGLHHHRDELHAVPLRRGRHAVLGRAGEARLQAGGAFVEADQPVGVGQAELSVSDGVHPDGGVLPDGGVV